MSAGRPDGTGPYSSGFWPRSASVEERFYAKTRQADGGCLQWIASRTTFGHGQFFFEGRTHRAHRVAWTLHTGDRLTASQVILHLCDNPPCVAIEHLVLGTNSQNISEMHAKGRASLYRKTVYGDDVIALARRMHEEKYSYADIAAETGIHENYVWAVVQGRRRVLLKPDPSSFSLRVQSERAKGKENVRWITELGTSPVHPSDAIVGEKWKDTDYPRYMVSNLGRVVGPRKRILRPSIRPNGMYPFVTCGRGNVKSVHTLVCTAFHGPRPPGMEVAHYDGDSHNNRADNLRWATHAENSADMTRHGSHRERVGERVPSSKLSAAQVRLIRSIEPWHGSQTYLAKRFGVCQTTIHNVVTGKTWTSLLP